MTSKPALIRALIFFAMVFLLNIILNFFMKLGQDITYILLLSAVTTALYYGLMAMRDKWSK